MHPIVTLLIVVVVALIGYFFPKAYNDYFDGEYRKKIVSIPLASTTAVFLALWLILMDFGGFWYWALLICSILLFVVSVLRVIYNGLSVGASIFEIIVAVLAQIFAIAGIAILIIGVFALIMEATGQKKRKR